MENEGEEQETNASSHGSLLDTFCEITSTSRDEAQFFLESHNFDLDSAVSTFLESSSSSSNPPAATAPAPPPAAAQPHRNTSPSQSQSYSPSASESSSPSRSRSPSPRPHLRSLQSHNNSNNSYNLRSRQPSSARASKQRATGTRTFSDLNRTVVHSSDSDDDPPQYFSGGERSGMLVQDPSKSNDVDTIFDQARQYGVVEAPEDSVHPSSATGSFTGTSMRLSGETVPSDHEQPEAVTHNIVFWRNGFTVDDGPLRRLDDPTNSSFLESIKRSECPKELEPVNRKTAVHVNLTRKEENFPVVKRSRAPFQGVGRTIGSTSSTSQVEQIGTSLSLKTKTYPPATGVVVDQSLPCTSIQLRLADGTRLISHFNFHHTIRDIRASIDSLRPDGVAYQLQTVGFPPKQLTDPDQTIEQAGLANSVVIQKI